MEVGAQLCVWGGVFGVWRPTFSKFAFSGEFAYFAVLGVFEDF